jgi:hypothetical protein
VIIGIAALPEYGEVLLIVPVRVEQPVCCIKMFLPENGYFFHHFGY